MIIGCHVSFGKEQLLNAVKSAVSYGASTFMFYTGAPENTMRKPINMDYTREAVELMKENNIDINNVICHAPYIINLANRALNKYEFSINFLKNEIKRCEELGITKIVLHPGSAVTYTKEEALKNIIDALNEVLKEDSNVIILLETMAGKGTECGRTLEEIKSIIENIEKKDRIGVCIDTCHLNDAGYDMSNFDDFLSIFDDLIGLDKLLCVHVNDSKNPLESHKDRHENIGMGHIGFDALSKIVHHEKLKDVPKILETPFIGDTNESKERLYPPYKFEIEMLKNNVYDELFLEKIRNFYK